MKSLFKNSFYNIIYTVLNVVFPLVTSIIVSRILLADGVGRVSYAQTIATYFTSIATLGLPIYAVRTLSQNKNQNLNKVYSELFVINFIINLASSLIYFILVLFTPIFETDREIYLAFGLMVMFGTLNVDWLYKGIEQYKFIAIRNLIVKVISLVCIILFVRTKEDCLIYAIITAAALSLNHLLNFVFGFKYCKFNFKDFSLKRHIKPIIILSIAAFFGLIYSKIDITMLGMLSTNESVGLYNNAHQCINIVLTCATSITAVFLPRLSSIAQDNDEKQLIDLLKTGTNILIFISIPAVAGLIITSPKVIVLLFGDSFASAGATLQILSVLAIIVSIGDLLAYQFIIAKGYEKKRILVSFLGCVINITLNLVFIPMLAQNGAAIATIISELFINVYLIIFVCRKIKFRFDLEVIWKTLLSTAVMCGVVIPLYLFIDNIVVCCVVSICAGVLAYGLVSFIVKNPIFKLFIKPKKV